MKKKLTAILIFINLFISANATEIVKPVYLDNTKPIEERVKDALSRMTLEEKVAMCHAQSKFSSKGVPRLGIPEVWSDDGPHGIRQEVFWDEWLGANWTNDSCTAFPALTCLAATFNPELSYSYGKSIGEEARYRNKGILLGPGVNIYRTPLNGRNFEYMGEDPFLSSKMVVPYIQGVQLNGVAACVKHFALNNQEEKRMYIDVEVSNRALNEIYLPAFKAAVEQGKVWSVMGSYNKFRGVHCCHNDLLLNQILKTDWKFDGVVVSDWGGVHNTDEAVHNGLDLEMGTSTDGLVTKGKLKYSEYYLANPFLKGLNSGKYEESLLNDKVSRILRLIFRTTMNSDRPYGKFVSPEHSAVARQIAEQGVVLLKNDNQLLPVRIGKYKKIAVIGENATRSLVIGGGSSSLKAAYEVSPLDGLVNLYGKETIDYTQGYSSTSDSLVADSLFKSAIKIAKEAEIVFFFGGLNKNRFQDCEGVDRKNMNLPYDQDKLIDALQKTNKNIVVILCSGNAVEMPWVNRVPSIIQSWYLGSESGNAIAYILSGNVNPSGKLPFSFPKKLEENAAHSFGLISYPGDSSKVIYKEDILVGYRWFDTKKIKPLFPFGFGLSYTTFEFSHLTTDKLVYSVGDSVLVNFRMKNTGSCHGAEVAQLYVNDPICSVLRPVKELKGFTKVFLKPGEIKTVSISLKISDIAFYNEIQKKWVVEPGNFKLLIGTSAGDIKLSSNISVR